jgi:hypothetical protein
MGDKGLCTIDVRLSRRRPAQHHIDRPALDARTDGLLAPIRPTVSAPCCRAVSTGSGSTWCPQLAFRRTAERHQRVPASEKGLVVLRR